MLPVSNKALSCGFVVLIMDGHLWLGTDPAVSTKKKNIFSSVFVFIVLFLSFYSFSSSGRLRTVGLNALTVMEL